jgi:crossover junction endodeoxyribonuclease RuvC
MRILGIDPGLQVTGYGFLDIADGSLGCGETGTIRTGTGALSGRLECIFVKVRELLDKYAPDEIALEQGFYGKNVRVALALGQARGVVLLACSMARKPIHEYSPREVKLSLVGNGAASKEQVSYMVTSLLNLPEAPQAYDISDALAVAYCHYQRREQLV